MSTQASSPKTRNRWLPYVGVVFALFVALAASGAPSPTYVDFQKLWDLSPLALTVAYSAYSDGVIVALLTIGGISDRIGRTPVLVVSLLILSASLLGLATAPNLWLLIIARLVQGLATGMLTGAASAALAETHPHGDATAAAATNSMTTSLAIAIGALVSGTMLDINIGLRIPFYILFVTCLLSIVLILVAPPDSRSAKAGRLISIQHLSVPSRIRGEFAVAALCVTASWSVGGLYLALGRTMAGSLLNMYAHSTSGVVILAVQGVGSVVQFAWIRANPNISLQHLVYIGMLALGSGTTLTAIGAVFMTPWIAVLGAFISGVGFGLSFMVGTKIVTNSAPDKQLSEVLAAYFVVAYFAISVPSIGVSFIIMRMGAGIAFAVFTFLICVVCAFSALIAHTKSISSNY